MNKYEIVGIVGEGAYGIVYKAKNKDNGENVAIKKFKESTDEDEVVKKTTNREIRMLKTLRHENIVVLKEAFKRKGKLYLVFEFVDKTLLEILEERTTGLQANIVKRYIFQLLKAIDYCHQMNVVHRDIKPENLLIDPSDNLKLCDFGFARNIPQTKQNPQMTDYVATRWYRSPELLLSDRYSREVDIWAIGCIMGELSDGEPLFPGESEVDQLFEIQKILGALTPFQQEQFAKNPRFMGFKFPDVTKPETIEKKYGGKISKEGLALMRGLLEMDPKERLSAKQALMHPFFDGLRTQAEEDQIIKDREKGLKRVESSTNPRNGTMSRNDQSRSRSGLRNNKIIKGTANQKRFNQQSDPIQDMSNKSRSLGRKNNEKGQMILNQNMPYGQINNIRDSSVSNTSNPNGSSSLATYTSNGGKKSNYGSSNAGNNFGMMNNFMPSNLVPQNFYNQGQSRGGPSDSAYNYEINLNAVNKSLGTANPASTQEQMKLNHHRSGSNDYDNHPKSIYQNKQSTSNPRSMEKGGISTGGNNVIMEMDAENNEDESYYLSQSPIRKNKNNNKANAGILSTNPSTFGLENMNIAGNQQNQQYQNQYSPSSGGGLNVNGGKHGNTKKSNAHLAVGAANGTIGGATHGYGPIGGGGLAGSRSNGTSVQNTMPNYNAIPAHLNINVFKQSSTGGGNAGHGSTAIKDSAPFSKINNKIKKRQFTNNMASGLQTSCNTNPGRAAQQEKQQTTSTKDRDGSVDATSSYNIAGGQIRGGQAAGGNGNANGRLRDNSEGTKESAYMTTQLVSGGSITGDPGIDSSGANISPRGTKNLEKMNVMNFISKNKNGRDRSGAAEGRFDQQQTELQPSSEYQKAINRQGSKKLMQGSHLMQHHAGAGSQFSNQFMQNKHAFNALGSGNGGGYEYDINLPNSNTKNVIGESVGSNQSSVVGHYNEGGSAQNRESSSQNNFTMAGNINVKKSMIKMSAVDRVNERATNDIRDREMDMSPKSSKELNFTNQNQWKNQKY